MSTKPVPADTSRISTLRLGAILKEVYFPENLAELTEIYANIGNIKTIVLGGITNTLIVDDPCLPFIVTNKLKEIVISNNYLYASGGDSVIRVCNAALEYELSGLEKLSGIPGTIGGAIKNNSGCFGSTISDYLDKVFIFDWDMGKIKELKKDELAFGYRYSNIEQDKDIIVGASFILAPSKYALIHKTMQDVAFMRRDTQPKGKSLGSVFKRYEDVSAGYYIDKVGLKGFTHNGMEISSIHANFIINNGGTVDDYLYLVEMAKTRVFEQFGIKLEEEVRIIGLRQSIENS
ncbi:MAG TPA: UDP-N-acetylmuramate dehydrogenase [Clostridia bacterium]|nr:UDP-N-acetylmuramate dehydrogenase [Clostridia bacterium]